MGVAHLLATSDSARALKRWGPPGLHGLGSHLAHLWATSDCAPRFEALGTPQAVGVI